MVRGARENNFIMMAPGYEEGFGLIKGVAIDQHMLTRNRQDDLEEVVAKHPELLGIGLDESTAIVVQRPAVRGRSAPARSRSTTAASCAQERSSGNGKKYFFMAPGERYDLTKLERIGKPTAERTRDLAGATFLGGMMRRGGLRRPSARAPSASAGAPRIRPAGLPARPALASTPRSCASASKR